MMSRKRDHPFERLMSVIQTIFRPMTQKAHTKTPFRCLRPKGMRVIMSRRVVMVDSGIS